MPLGCCKDKPLSVRLDRRRFLRSTGALGLGAWAQPRLVQAVGTGKPGKTAWDCIVIGAGVFGAWTAWHALKRGQRTLLLDAHGPAHARASSGGESRMTRTAYGKDEVYARMAHDSLADWQALSSKADLPLFAPLGVLFMFARQEPYVLDTLATHRRLGLPTQVLNGKDLSARFPQIDTTGIELGLYEPQMGALMARRAVQTLVARFIAAGGAYAQAAVLPLESGADLAQGLQTAGGQRFFADRFIFACGPWLPKIVPHALAGRIFPTRQEVFFFAPPPGDGRFAPGACPGWADFNEGDIYYGFPDLEARGFKIAHDAHGPAIDPDQGDRIASAAGLADVRAYMARRFPALAEAPLVESRVCQYENSANGDVLLDRLPGLAAGGPQAFVIGAGSGHGFKHGPAMGRLAVALAFDGTAPPERFSLASKAMAQKRDVH
jgi:sarcosine oxidase